MRAGCSILSAAIAFAVGASLAGAFTAFGPVVNLEVGFPAPGKLAVGGSFFGDYGPAYVRIYGAYSPMPAPPEIHRDWPPPSERDDRGYASCEAFGAYFSGGSAAFGPAFYYRFGRGVRDYYYHAYGPTITNLTEDYVSFQHDFFGAAAYRLRAEGKGTAVVWGGVGLSRFVRSGLLYSWYSDYYNPEKTYEIVTPLDTGSVGLAAAAGGDLRSGFARHFGLFGSARFVLPLADLHLRGYDAEQPDVNVALTGGVFVGW